MKNNLLLVAVLTVSMLASAQAPSPYPYSSFKKYDGVTPTYSVPDVAIPTPAALDAVTLAVASTQTLGLQCINFDQVSATEASSYVSDYLKTCGPTPSAFAETAATVSTIRSWVTDDVNFAAGSVYSSVKEPWLGFNSNPSTFRFSGGWYYYTVNFTEAAEYEFFLRLRSGNMRLVGKLVGGVPQDVDKIVTIQIYDKSDMANPLKTWTLNFGGIAVGTTTVTSPSTDASVSFYAWAKQAAGTGTAGQGGTFWSKATATYRIPAAGEYVIKITDPTLKITGQDTAPAAGDTNNAIGSFTFIKKTTTGVNNVNTVNGFASVIGKDVKVSSNVQSVEVYNLTGSKIKSGKIEGNQFRIGTAGVYMIKMITAEGNKIQKGVMR